MAHTITTHSVSTAPLPRSADKSVVQLISYTNDSNAAHTLILVYWFAVPFFLHVIKLQTCQDVTILRRKYYAVMIFL